MAKNPVTAKKGNRTKEFTLNNWNNMPKDKYGWELIHHADPIPTPPEVKMDTEKVSISSLPEKKAPVTTESEKIESLKPANEQVKSETPKSAPKKKGGRPAKK